jgi:uncharacterized protein
MAGGFVIAGAASAGLKTGRYRDNPYRNLERLMKCPQCVQSDLVMTDRQGVEIDYCPTCRGVWLDRGELDKLIERAGQYEASIRGRRDDDDADDDHDRRRYQQRPDPAYGNPQYAPPPQHYPHPQQHYKKKKSFWSELFD